MNDEFRDLSKLPHDADYWDGLESRIMAELGPRVRGAATVAGVWSPLAGSAWPLGGLAAAAVLAALLLTPARPAPPSGAAGLLSLPEGEPALYALMSAPAPPSLASLLLTDHRSDR